MNKALTDEALDLVRNQTFISSWFDFSAHLKMSIERSTKNSDRERKKVERHVTNNMPDYMVIFINSPVKGYAKIYVESFRKLTSASSTQIESS